MRRLLLLIACVALACQPLMAEQAQGTLAALDAGTCSTAGSYVRMTLGTADSTAAITLTNAGTAWAATVAFVGSVDNGRSWAQMAGVPWSTPTTVAPVTSGSAAGGWTFDVTGKTNVCAYVSQYTSGTVIVGITSSASRAASLAIGNPSLTASNLNQAILADGNGLRVRTLPIWDSNDRVTAKPISATGAVNNAVTLTFPAPAPGLYNYVCSLSVTVAQDGTATAVNNSVTTSTNFNSFAFQFSAEDVAQKVYVQTMDLSTPIGCAKSDLPGTATTIVSPSAVANASFAFQATYYQAP